MKPAYITCIKDEEDLIFYNLIYHYNIGIRDFYIIFNNSNSETRKQVNKFSILKFDANVYTENDNDIAYLQAIRLKRLADMAYNNGCDWIIPIDADEILKINIYKNIQEYLKNFNNHKYGYINCRWFDYHNHILTNIKNNYFVEWRYREMNPRPQARLL